MHGREIRKYGSHSRPGRRERKKTPNSFIGSGIRPSARKPSDREINSIKMADPPISSLGILEILHCTFSVVRLPSLFQGLVRGERGADGERGHHPRLRAGRGAPLEHRLRRLRRHPPRRRRRHDAPPRDAQLARQQRQARGGAKGEYQDWREIRKDTMCTRVYPFGGQRGRNWQLARERDPLPALSLFE